MGNDMLFLQTLKDLQEMQQLTEAKIQAVIARQAEHLILLLQQQLDPMYRLNARMLDLPSLTEAQKAELQSHITRWANREQYLGELLVKNLGYIDYLRHLLGIAGQEQPGLNIGL